MKTPTGSQADPREFALDVDGVDLLAPCMSFVLFLDEDDNAGIQEWHDRAVELLGPALTHYRALDQANRRPVTSRALRMLATWIARPSATRAYYLEYYGGGDDGGASSANLELLWVGRTWADKTPEQRATWMESWRGRAARGENVRRFLPCSVLRLTLPLDHPAASPDGLWAWARDLRLVRDGHFGTGYAGYALNYDESANDSPEQRLAKRRLGALCLRHPGLDWHNAYYIRSRMLPYEPSVHAHVPQVKRANWLTLLSNTTVRWLGGSGALTAALRTATHADGAPPMPVDALGGGALAIRAGVAPAVGDVEAGDFLPAYRAVAAAVRRARLDEIEAPSGVFPPYGAQTWLEAFDEPVPGGAS